MAWLLFPGRHHLLTRFQRRYLTRACRKGIDGILWAVTSANHENTRRNPLPAHRREAAIERMAAGLPVPSYVYWVDDVGATPRFAEYVLKKIEVESRGRFRLTPRNAAVACSTPEVASQYERAGFRILPVERGTPEPAPWALLEGLVRAGGMDRAFRAKADPASVELYERYGYDRLIADLHRSPILTEDGDLTATRDYNTYVRAFDEGAARKYELIKDLVLPGRIVDIGCCTGALLAKLARDGRLRESDFYGVEIARPLVAECLHRKARGDFGDANVFFHHADAVGRSLFASRSLQTVTTFALTHELESYQGRRALTAFMGRIREQLAPGGRWLNVDVVGPEDGGRLVWLWLDRERGGETDVDREFAPEERDAQRKYLERLSTYGRFLRFARQFRRQEGYRLRYALDRRRPGYVRLALRDACEFLSKKDYTDNWDSELHETFCFWSFSDWRAAARRAGFRVHPASHAFTNPWIVKRRYEGKARLYAEEGGRLAPLPWPPTNMVLALERAK
ncbi:MAG: methyltransferase domain-containing protein [Elusimicrobia bacterium]|nr:methyltransferase domain-containing protein [Elusimicrobiota bacterium]